ncbi:hypothetical protein ACQKH5_06740 [Hyphomonas sp. NPDC076900]|uniref:hypothetical protein n=1 Tax=unclassified Hyphomonas TaxID=2630699 RepID=UPI003CFF3217
MKNDAEYLKILVDPIRVCASYRPKMGNGREKGYDLLTFQSLYQADPLYGWFGLDNPLMYAAHKAAGGMTSIYRQVGIGCERLFRQILIDQLGLSADEANWSYSIPIAGGKTRTLHLDGRIQFDAVKDAAARKRVEAWVQKSAADLGVNSAVAAALTGAVFEVRQGYKSKDSKRQNADIANAATAYVNTYLPCAVILSTQIDGDILSRYRGEKWSIIIGSLSDDEMRSTYAFMKKVVGYDLASFFSRNSDALKMEIDLVLKQLLDAN